MKRVLLERLAERKSLRSEREGKDEEKSVGGNFSRGKTSGDWVGNYPKHILTKKESRRKGKKDDRGFCKRR